MTDNSRETSQHSKSSEESETQLSSGGSGRSSGRSSLTSSELELEYNFSEPVVPVQRQLSDATISKLRHVHLTTFLTYEPGKEAFRAFLVKEFSVENLLFVESVQQHNANPARTRADCVALCDNFITESSPNQVNLPSVVVQRLVARLQDSEPGESLNGLFDDASAHVMKLMQRDAFKRFQRTQAWYTHVAVFKVVEKSGATTSPETTASPTPAGPTTAIPTPAGPGEATQAPVEPPTPASSCVPPTPMAADIALSVLPSSNHAADDNTRANADAQS
jgi:hypothetical protein